MTDPLNSFHTNFGRFYGHPKFRLEELRRRTALSVAMGNEIVSANLNDPYAPKPSITNIIGMLDKKFLPPYYARLVAEYAVKNLEGVRYQVEKFGPEVAIGALKAIPNQQNRNASIGDEVHEAIDLWVTQGETGVPFVYDFSTSTASAMFTQFLHFMEVRHPRILRSEYTVWSYEHGYAGTGDLMWQDEDGLWLVDTKTGNQVHPEVAMQTSAAAHADVILDAQGNESPMPLADFQGVLHVRPRSVKLHKLERTEESFQAFLGLKRAFDWVRYDREHVIQEAYKTEYRKDAA